MADSNSRKVTGIDRLPTEVSYTHYARPWTLNQERRGSTHWSQRSSMVSTWREAFFWLGTQNKVKLKQANVEVTIRMKRPLADTGNAYGSVKAAIDGLVDAGILPGDGPTVIMRLCMNAPVACLKGEQESLTVTLKGEPDE